MLCFDIYKYVIWLKYVQRVFIIQKKYNINIKRITHSCVPCESIGAMVLYEDFKLII